MKLLCSRAMTPLFVICLCLAIASESRGDLGRQLHELVPTQPYSFQDFGDSVAIGGGFVVVGAEDTPGGNGTVASAGAVYLFDLATWSEQVVITLDPPASRSFGTAVGISGNVVVAGAADENSARGAAYLFNTNGAFLHRLVASDAAPNAEFGSAVAIAGNRALIGAPSAGGFAGKAYLFDTDTGLQIGDPIQPAGLPAFGEFGDVLGMDGNRAVIGLSGSDLGGPVFVYDLNDMSAPLQIDPPIDPITMNPVRGFGRSVSISGSRVLIGATPGDTTVLPGEAGRAYIYDAITGDMIWELTPHDSQGENLFGEDVALDGNLALVAARREPFLGLVNKSYLFDVTTGQQLTSFVGDNVQPGHESAEALAVYRGRAVVGAESVSTPGFSSNGIAVVFDVLVGDFNKDGLLDCADIDSLVQNIVDGSTDLRFDITGDGLVNHDDLTSWRVNAGSINLESREPYLMGDANLDGSVDGSDFGVWNANKFTSVAGWCSGDFNADGSVDGSDFGVWNANKFTSADSATVPEPNGLTLLIAGLMLGRITSLKSRSDIPDFQ